MASIGVNGRILYNPNVPPPQILTGRPSTYRPEWGEAICQHLATGKSIMQIAAIDGFPTWDCIFTWLDRYPEFAERYARARITRAHARFESIAVTLQDMRDGKIEAQAARVEVEAIKWCCAKEFPRTYGEHQTVDHKISWDGDLARLDEGQLSKLMLSLEQLASGKAAAQLGAGDPVTIDAASEPVTGEPEPSSDG